MNRYLRTLYIVTLTLCLTSCWTSIWTVAPVAEPVAPPKTVYTTTVTTPTPKTTTVTTVTVTGYNSDPCFYLDLNAVAAAFAESRSVQEFEQLLNSRRYMINNLDLNRDGWVDYLRVIETHRGYYHTMLIQACLAPSVFQDVATLVAEWHADRLYVEVIGDRFLYGYNYIVRPVFVKRPPMWDVYGRSTYSVWSSPYYYGYYPSYYSQPKPIYLNHYQAYVTTYMSNHHYCHHCDYPSQPYYSGYTQMTQSYTRQDYQNAHPDEGFDQRVTHRLTSNGSGVTVRNAGQLRTEVNRQQASSTSTSTSSSSSSSRTNTQSSGVTQRTSDQSSQTTPQRTSSSSTTTSSTTSRTSTQHTSTTTRPSTPTKQQPAVPSTSVESRVNKSGTTRTTIRTTDNTGRTTTTKRETSTKREPNTTRQTTTRSSNTSSGSSSGTSTRTRK